MKYNIDTKENFDIITPISATLDRILIDELTKEANNSKNNERSVIFNFESIKESSVDDVLFVYDLHDMMYQKNLSFALCCIQEDVKNKLALDDERINITPKLIEAIDIVSMESLERELMGDDVFDEGDDMNF